MDLKGLLGLRGRGGEGRGGAKLEGERGTCRKNLWWGKEKVTVVPSNSS